MIETGLSPMTKFLLLAFLVLLLNSAYLASFADPTVFYMGNVLLHLFLGIALILPFLMWLRQQFRNLSVLSRIGAVFMLLGGMIGAVLIWTGTYRPYRWALHWHIGFMTAGTVLLGLGL